jgi:hypothetical protein
VAWHRRNNSISYLGCLGDRIEGVEMTLEIAKIEDQGDLERERIVLRVTADADIGWYAVFRCTTNPDGKGILGGPISHVYWFANKKVKNGDLIIIYSKHGVRSEKTGENGVTSHFFYWQLDTPIWIKGKRAVVVETPIWTLGESIIA